MEDVEINMIIKTRVFQLTIIKDIHKRSQKKIFFTKKIQSLHYIILIEISYLDLEIKI